MEFQNGSVLLHNPSTWEWLLFKEPLRILAAHRIDQVQPLLWQLNQEIEKSGRFAAGFLTYEAAPAFDPAFKVVSGGRLPLAWFGLFPAPEIVERPEVILAEPENGIVWEPSIAVDQYRKAIERVKSYIRAGETYQVNYTFRLNAPLERPEVEALFSEMVAAQGPHYAAFIETAEFCICSASPELFFRLNDEELICKPMKGTAARGLWRAQDNEQVVHALLSPKNRAENIMIVDMVRNDMGRIAETGSVQLVELFKTEQYPTLWQLTSSVACKTRQSIPEIFRALFPPASVTGAPKVRTMEIIADLEALPRNIYTGAIGFIAPGRQAQFNVAIRTLLLDKRTGRAEYGTGSGIVWDSQPEQEFEECLTKSRILSRPPATFQLLETIAWQPQGGFVLLEAHLNRMTEAADYFGFAFSARGLRQKLCSLTSSFPLTAQRVRVLAGANGSISIETNPLNKLPSPYVVAVAREPIHSQDRFLYHKTTHRNVYDRARANQPGFHDVLLWNEKRELTESTVANLVLEIGGNLVTPKIDSGLLPGLFRAQLLQRKEVREERLLLEDLERSGRIYLCNSVRGLWEVKLCREAT